MKSSYIILVLLGCITDSIHSIHFKLEDQDDDLIKDYTDDSPVGYSNIVDEAIKDQEVKIKKDEDENSKNAKDKASKAKEEMDELMKGATEAVK